MHPTDKRHRMLIRMKKYKRRVREIGLDENRLNKKYVHQGQPCSCIGCAGEKYYRPKDSIYMVEKDAL